MRFAGYRNPESFRPLIDDRTKALFCESIGNPLGNVVDLAAPAVANYLKGHAKVKWVNCAGLPDHADHALIRKYMGGRASGILSFGVEGGMAGGGGFRGALTLVTRRVNIGEANRLACHPASTTHRQLGAEERKKAGVSEDMVRLSIGIEHIDDIKADLEQALAAV